jgi:hypothetical protein
MPCICNTLTKASSVVIFMGRSPDLVNRCDPANWFGAETFGRLGEVLEEVQSTLFANRHSIASASCGQSHGVR